MRGTYFLVPVLQTPLEVGGRAGSRSFTKESCTSSQPRRRALSAHKFILTYGYRRAACSRTFRVLINPEFAFFNNKRIIPDTSTSLNS